jgi:hypothetical protein
MEPVETVVEPDVNDEADRDAPRPADSDLPDPLDAPGPTVPDPWDTPAHNQDTDAGHGMDPAAERALATTLAQIKHHAHTTASTSTTGTGSGSGGRGRAPGKTELYVHLTDHTLGSGHGVLRVEGIGPMLASQLGELIGHGPYVVKPVLDLNDHPISVDAYEIPDAIRERIRLIYPVEQFPYGTAETTPRTDLDHIQPYQPTGPPGQTSMHNLAPLRRFSHRLKTHGGWTVQRLNKAALIWTSPYGHTFRVDHNGTHRIDQDLGDRVASGSISGAKHPTGEESH